MIKSEVSKEVDIKTLKVTSSAFQQNGMIPSKYTCDGMNVNPPIDIEGIPATAKSLVVIVDDPDAPVRTWVHWVVWDIPVTHHLKEKTTVGVKGVNDFGDNKYDGPCPPGGTHHYHFKVYALNELLRMPAQSTKSIIEKTMCDHIVGFGELIGIYKRVQ